MLARAVSQVASVAAGAVAKRWSPRSGIANTALRVGRRNDVVTAAGSTSRPFVTAAAAAAAASSPGLLGQDPVFAQTMLRVKDPKVRM